MAGSSNITGDESIIFADNASFDGTERGGKMTTNGQLWIGSTSSPHVKLGQLVAADDSIVVDYSSPNIVLRSTILNLVTPLIDFKVAGLTTLFTTSSTKTFVPQGETQIGITVTAPNGASQFNIGWTAPNYDDIVSGENFGILTSNDSSYLANASFSNCPVIPPNTIVRVNVTTPDGGAALTGRIAITGFYF